MAAKHQLSSSHTMPRWTTNPEKLSPMNKFDSTKILNGDESSSHLKLKVRANKAHSTQRRSFPSSKSGYNNPSHSGRMGHSSSHGGRNKTIRSPLNVPSESHKRPSIKRRATIPGAKKHKSDSLSRIKLHGSSSRSSPVEQLHKSMNDTYREYLIQNNLLSKEQLRKENMSVSEKSNPNYPDLANKSIEQIRSSTLHQPLPQQTLSSVDTKPLPKLKPSAESGPLPRQRPPSTSDHPLIKQRPPSTPDYPLAKPIPYSAADKLLMKQLLAEKKRNHVKTQKYKMHGTVVSKLMKERSKGRNMIEEVLRKQRALELTQTKLKIETSKNHSKPNSTISVARKVNHQISKKLNLPANAKHSLKYHIKKTFPKITSQSPSQKRNYKSYLKVVLQNASNTTTQHKSQPQSGDRNRLKTSSPNSYNSSHMTPSQASFQSQMLPRLQWSHGSVSPGISPASHTSTRSLSPSKSSCSARSQGLHMSPIKSKSNGSPKLTSMFASQSSLQPKPPPHHLPQLDDTARSPSLSRSIDAPISFGPPKALIISVSQTTSVSYAPLRSQTPLMSDLSPRFERSPKSYKSPKSEMSLNSEKLPKLQRSSKSERSPDSEWSPKSKRSLQSEKSPKSERSLGLERSPKLNRSLKSEKSPSSEKSPKSERSLKLERSPKSERSLGLDRSAKSERSPNTEKENLSQSTLKSEISQRLEFAPGPGKPMKLNLKVSVSLQNSPKADWSPNLEDFSPHIPEISQQLHSNLLFSQKLFQKNSPLFEKHASSTSPEVPVEKHCRRSISHSALTNSSYPSGQTPTRSSESSSAITNTPNRDFDNFDSPTNSKLKLCNHSLLDAVPKSNSRCGHAESKLDSLLCLQSLTNVVSETDNLHMKDSYEGNSRLETNGVPSPLLPLDLPDDFATKLDKLTDGPTILVKKHPLKVPLEEVQFISPPTHYQFQIHKFNSGSHVNVEISSLPSSKANAPKSLSNLNISNTVVPCTATVSSSLEVSTHTPAIISMQQTTPTVLMTTPSSQKATPKQKVAPTLQMNEFHTQIISLSSQTTTPTPPQATPTSPMTTPTPPMTTFSNSVTTKFTMYSTELTPEHEKVEEALFYPTKSPSISVASARLLSPPHSPPERLSPPHTSPERLTPPHTPPERLTPPHTSPEKLTPPHTSPERLTPPHTSPKKLTPSLDLSTVSATSDTDIPSLCSHSIATFAQTFESLAKLVVDISPFPTGSHSVTETDLLSPVLYAPAPTYLCYHDKNLDCDTTTLSDSSLSTPLIPLIPTNHENTQCQDLEDITLADPNLFIGSRYYTTMADQNQVQDKTLAEPALSTSESKEEKVATQKPENKNQLTDNILKTAQRAVKFSHSTVVGEPTVQIEPTKICADSSDTQLHIVNSPRGSMSSSRGFSLLSPDGKRERRFSIETQNDPIGYGMSSFLSTRDSIEVTSKKQGNTSSIAAAEERLRDHLNDLMNKVTTGSLGELEMRQLSNFAQKLVNAHSAGEVIGKIHSEGRDDDLEVIEDSVLPHVSPAVKSSKPDDANFNKIISGIERNELTLAQLNHLSLAIVNAASAHSGQEDKNVDSNVDGKGKKLKDSLIDSLQFTLKSPSTSHRNRTSSAVRTSTSRVKWHDLPDSQDLIRVLQKLKAQMVLAPNGGSFVESIEKVVNDVAEDHSCNFFYDSMIISLCLIITYQQWQNEHGQWKSPNNHVLTKFDVLANDIIISMFQKLTNGMQCDDFKMEDLIRLTTLVASCDYIKPQPGYEVLAGSRRCSVQSEPTCKEQEGIVVDALEMMKQLLTTEKVSTQELKSLAMAAYKLQSTHIGTAMTACNSCIWTVRNSSSRLIQRWSLPQAVKPEERSNVEVSYVTHLRVRLNSLKQRYSSSSFLHTTFSIMEAGLDTLALNSEVTGFWAACLVLVVALIFEKIKAEYYTSALDYKVLDLLVNNLVYEAFNVSLRTLQENHINLATFQLLTTAVTTYRVQEATLPSFGLSPKSVSSGNSSSVSSPYAVMDFLEKSLQVIKSAAAVDPLEVKALGDYVLNLQQFYALESEKATESSSDTSNPTTNRSASAPDRNDKLNQIITPQHILEHLDEAIERIGQQDASADDVISLACFLIHLVEIPEKLARSEQLTFSKEYCHIKELEKRIQKIRQTMHYIPRFDFILNNLEKSLKDLQSFALASYNYDLSLLSMCVFIAYEWIRTEPLSVFSTTKLDSRAATIIYEAMQSTLKGIKNGVLSLDDLQNLTSVITNTTDLRRASAVNLSLKQYRTSSIVQSFSSAVLLNETRVLELIDELLLSDSDEINVGKLSQSIMLMQHGSVSNYIYEILILALYIAASRHKSDFLLCSPTTKEQLSSVPRPDSSAHNFVINTLKRAADGLRSGSVQPIEMRSIVDNLLHDEHQIIQPHKLKEAIANFKTSGADLVMMLRQLENESPKSPNVAVDKVINFLWNASTTEDKEQDASAPVCRNKSWAECQVVKVVEPELPYRFSILKSKGSPLPKFPPAFSTDITDSWSGEGQVEESAEQQPTGKVMAAVATEAEIREGQTTNRTYLLRELTKDAIGQLTRYVSSGYFTDDQLQSLSDTLYHINSYHHTSHSDEGEKGVMEKELSKVLTTVKILVNNPVQTEAILCVRSASRADGSNTSANRHTPELSTKMSASNQDKGDLKHALNIVINGLEHGQFSREEIDTLSHSLGQAFHNQQPVPDTVKDVELHGMMGKRPLQVSSEFLSETLAGISVKPDGMRRYSYKSLVNPDLSKVEGIGGVAEKNIGRRLSMLSDANLASVGMAPFNEAERGRRRSSIPTHDFVLRPVPDVNDNEEEEEEDDVWQGSLHEVKVSDVQDLHQSEADTSQKKSKSEDRKSKEKKNKNNSSTLEEKVSDQSLPSQSDGTTPHDDGILGQRNNNANERYIATDHSMVPCSTLENSKRTTPVVVGDLNSVAANQSQDINFAQPRTYPRPSKPGCRVTSKTAEDTACGGKTKTVSGKLKGKSKSKETKKKISVPDLRCYSINKKVAKK